MLVAILGTAHPGSAPSAPNDAALASHAIVPPGHPPANVANQVPFNCDLYAIDDTPDCIFSSLLNIDYARSLEGVGPMVLPSDYAGLAPSQQLFVIFNLERTSRGLPPLVELDASADNDALTGALESTDPAAPGSSSFQAGPSIAAFGVGNALQADWEWMYTDGCYPYVGNAGCTSESPNDPAGWNHRDAILGDYGSDPAAGAAEATATSGAYPGSLTWTAEFGDPLWAIPNSETAFLNSSVSYPSGAPPHLVRLNPSSGGVGSHITVQGVYLSGASAVEFDGSGCTAAPSVASDESADVVIPPCAAGTVSLQVVVAPDVSNALSYNAVGPVVATASATVRPPFVAMASTPGGNGYWEVASDGGVFTFGGAAFHGSMGGRHLNAPVVGMATTADGGGYWLVSADGGVFAFGDAGFYGSAGALRLVRPVVGMAATADGRGYWLVASDGGVFAYGDARFQGSMGGRHLNEPVVGMAADPATGGYWLVASDGGIFSFAAPFDGSTGNIRLNRPVVGIEAAPDGAGYRLVASDGGIFCFHLPFAGSEGAVRLDRPVVGMTAAGANGYWMVASDGGVFTFGGAGFFGSEG
ncbi:MAG TPA: IPT/TIG domain-containing protein [Acidimicrobiales bacterium]|nr:IPT/TIG domain-containing protein [Acidimicrobiales bacterium]